MRSVPFRPPAAPRASRDRAAQADRLVREPVAALVLDVAVVAAHPVPAYLVPARRRVELLPEVGVLDRLARRRPPAVLLPLRHPLLHAVLEILRVGPEVDGARLLQVVQPFDRGAQLHAVVGGRGLVAGHLAAVPAGDEDRGPAARSGVSLTGPVGEDLDPRVGHERSSSRAIVRICISVVPPPSSISLASRARRSTTYSSM